MNLVYYAHEYARFHGANSSYYERDIICIPYEERNMIKDIILKVRDFNKIIHSKEKPLLQALKVNFKTDAVSTVFLTDNPTMLLGNERVLFPYSEGKIIVCATPFFVKDPQIVRHYLTDTVSTLNERVFIHKKTVFYFDEFDIPSPGANYFENTQSDGMFRLCFITTERDSIKDLAEEWRLRREVLTLPFKTSHSTLSISKFIRENTVDEINFPDSSLVTTALINKRHPNFLLQDIFKTYLFNNPNKKSLRDLGLFIEYPLVIGYDTNHRASGNFIALTINGNQPKTVLRVRAPYERYSEFSYVPPTQWTHILYDSPRQTIPLDVQRVVIDSTVLGYRYKNVFFCLRYPMLHWNDFQKNLNSDALLNWNLKFDPKIDENLDVIETYRLDTHRMLHRLKHKEIDHELWCMVDTDEAPKKYAKRAVKTPELVDAWLQFVETNQHLKKTFYGDLDILKLALVLAKHKFCYAMKSSSKRDRFNIIFERQKDLIFEMDEKAIEFVNDMRLDSYEDNGKESGDDSTCTIM